jgi:hypothetical protein
MKSNYIEGKIGTRLYQINRDNRIDGLIESRFNIFECHFIFKYKQFTLFGFNLINQGNIDIKVYEKYTNFFNKLIYNTEEFKTIINLNKIDSINIDSDSFIIYNGCIIYISRNNTIINKFYDFAIDFNDLKQELNKLLKDELLILESKKENINSQIDTLIKQIGENGTQS